MHSNPKMCLTIRVSGSPILVYPVLTLGYDYLEKERNRVKKKQKQEKKYENFTENPLFVSVGDCMSPIPFWYPDLGVLSSPLV